MFRLLLSAICLLRALTACAPRTEPLARTQSTQSPPATPRAPELFLVTAGTLAVDGGVVYGDEHSTIVTDGIAFARVKGTVLEWTPALSCGLVPSDAVPIWGRYPHLFSGGLDELVRFDDRAQRWKSVTPRIPHWSASLGITPWSDGRRLLVIAPPRGGNTDDVKRSGPAPDPDPDPGFYLADEKLIRLEFEVGPEFLQVAGIDVGVTGHGDIVLLSTHGADIWRSGETKPITMAMDFRGPPGPRTGWVDVQRGRPPEVIRGSSQPPLVARFDGHSWSEVTVPFAGAITAWARDGDARIYAEATPGESLIWRRTPDDHWSTIDRIPNGRLVQLERGRGGEIWAAVIDGIMGPSFWYMPRPGRHDRVLLPAEYLGSWPRRLWITGSTAWVTAMGSEYRLFASRQFRQTGVRVRAGDDPCRATTSGSR